MSYFPWILGPANVGFAYAVPSKDLNVPSVSTVIARRAAKELEDPFKGFWGAQKVPGSRFQVPGATNNAQAARLGPPCGRSAGGLLQCPGCQSSSSSQLHPSTSTFAHPSPFVSLPPFLPPPKPPSQT